MNQFRTITFVCLGQLICMHPSFAQVNIRAQAQLFYEIATHRSSWSEGFSTCLKGTRDDYESHRSNGERDTAFVIRSGNNKTRMVWETGPLRSQSTTDSVRFVWVCGFGNNLATERFVLVVNDRFQFEFSTVSNPHWTVHGMNGGTLSFTAVYQNHNHANFGYMDLVLPHDGFKRGKTATVRVENLPSRNETWYRTFGYSDALSYLLLREVKKMFTDVECINFGDATIRIYASATRSGSKVSLFSNNKKLMGDIFRLKDNIATTEFDIPRKVQAQLKDFCVVSSGFATDTIWLKAIWEQRAKAFPGEELEFDKYVFPPGALPAVHWGRPAMVANEIGFAPISVTYYNSAMQPVQEATEIGRYGAVIRIVLPTGFVVERYTTLYCARVAMDDYSAYVPIVFSPHSGFGISSALWSRYRQKEQNFSFRSLKMFPVESGDAAIFLAGLSELDTTSNLHDTPRTRDRQWWITFKTRTADGKKKVNTLKVPKLVATHSEAVLTDSNQLDTTYSLEDLQAIRELCKASTDKTGVPIVTLIAHNGHIVFDEAFGHNQDGTLVTIDTPLWMASITKLLTGMLFMQFVEQGLVDLDAPLGEYLPELSNQSKNGITVRNLFTHTSGLSWVGEWGSDWEPSLENRIAYILPYSHAGERFEYHRIGYALAGKIMERITGVAVPYLFQQYIFAPLGLKEAFADNTYGGLYCTSRELAILAQTLLQRGRYDSTQLFSEKTFDKMLPFDLASINPTLKVKWGIGTALLGEDGLSPATFGHEAASGAILRIDPEKQLIIISARNEIGEDYNEYEHFVHRLIELCTKPFRKLK